MQIYKAKHAGFTISHKLDLWIISQCVHAMQLARQDSHHKLKIRLLFSTRGKIDAMQHQYNVTKRAACWQGLSLAIVAVFTRLCGLF